LECGAGVGSVLILRWFWWRINAWSEISAMITPFVVFPIISSMGIKFPYTLYYLVISTTVVWITVTFLTKPVDDEVLFSFYRKIHPGGVFWKKVSDKLPDVKSDTGFFKMFVNWFLGVILVYSFLFGTGKLIFGDYTAFSIYLIAAIISAIIIYKNLSAIGWDEVIK
jgi:SSS family solute:Na+ symporter